MAISSAIGRVPDSVGGRVPALHTSLRRYYDVLFAAYGPQHWWPGRTAFEIIVGAILTQNTSWSNVEIAKRNLRREKLLTPRAIERVSLPRLAQLVRSSGYFRQKAKKLKCFVRFLRSEYVGSVGRMFRPPTAAARGKKFVVHRRLSYDPQRVLRFVG